MHDQGWGRVRLRIFVNGLQKLVQSQNVQDVRKIGEMCRGANLTTLERYRWTLGESNLGFPQLGADCLIKHEDAC